MGVVGKKAKEVLYTEEAEAFAKDLPRLSKIPLRELNRALEIKRKLGL